MTYNPNNKIYCKFCKKSFNEKYKLRHSRKPRHIKLVEDFEENERLEGERIERERLEKIELVKSLITELGMDEINRINEDMKPKKLDIGKDCWDIIMDYKYQLDRVDLNKQFLNHFHFKRNVVYKYSLKVYMESNNKLTIKKYDIDTGRRLNRIVIYEDNESGYRIGGFGISVYQQIIRENIFNI